MAQSVEWLPQHRNVVIASFFAWTLDAFDYFLLVFSIGRLASDFHTSISDMTVATFLTLAMRPLGAFLFGLFADARGRRPALIASVLLYSALELASAFAPTLAVFLTLRALFGIAMGGEWGVGAALAFESIPVRSRGAISGLLQSGYPCGYLLAAIAYGLLFDRIGWRGMFMVGAAPAVLVLYIAAKVPESPVWLEGRVSTGERRRPWSGLAAYWSVALYAVILMTAFNFFSHGTQDMYPTYLQKQRGFSTGTVSTIAIIYNIGAICGGLLFGRLSSRLGRRRTIAIAAALALPAVPFFAFSSNPAHTAIAAFAMQFMVQGAWGVVPVYLNELAPAALRATFPGFVYQLGNLLASSNAKLQSLVAISHGGEASPDYGFALALFSGTVAIVLVVLAALGPERRDVKFTAQ